MGRQLQEVLKDAGLPLEFFVGARTQELRRLADPFAAGGIPCYIGDATPF